MKKKKQTYNAIYITKNIRRRYTCKIKSLNSFFFIPLPPQVIKLFRTRGRGALAGLSQMGENDQFNSSDQKNIGSERVSSLDCGLDQLKSFCLLLAPVKSWRHRPENTLICLKNSKRHSWHLSVQDEAIVSLWTPDYGSTTILLKWKVPLFSWSFLRHPQAYN